MAKRKTDIRPSTESTSGDISILSVECATGFTQQLSSAAVEVPSNGSASWSLRRLGSDIRQLEATWQYLGGKLRARDAHITKLLAELDSRGSKIQRLQTDLQSAQTRNAQLADALRDMQIKSKPLQQPTNEQSDPLRKERIMERGGDVQSHNAALLAILQDLKLYVDGRKDEWAQLRFRPANYQNALGSMEQDVIDRKAAAAQQERDKVDLALRIVSLERRCAELDGRRAKREDASAELLAALDVRTKELKRLNENVSRIQKEVSKLSTGIRTGQTEVNSRNSEISKPDEEIVILAEVLKNETGLSVDLVTQLKSATGQLDKLQLQSEDHDPAFRQSGVSGLSEPPLADQTQRLQNGAGKEALDDQLAATKTQVCLLRNQLAQLTEKHDWLETQLLGANEHRTESAVVQERRRTESDNFDTDLFAQRGLIDALENNPSDKLDNFDVFGERVDQVDDFDTDIEILFQSASLSQLNIMPMLAQFLIVPLEPDATETKYPLDKNVLTIGRDGNNDIPIFDNHISRVHARIILEGSQVIIEDMGSKNGILVNSEATKRHELKHGDRFSVGLKKFELIDLGVSIRGAPATQRFESTVSERATPWLQ